MKNYKPTAWYVLRYLFAAAALLGAANVEALDTKELLPDGPSKKLLESKKPILCETEGVVEVDYAQALRVFSHENLMINVQAAYKDHVLKEGDPEFAIQQTSAAEYHYENRKGERTEIVEIMRRQTSAETFDIILYATGKRFFGNYQALIHVQLLDCEEAGVGYITAVYAYPENAVSRFFARHLKLVEKFFDKKTDHLTEMITVISRSLCEEELAKEEIKETDSKTS